MYPNSVLGLIENAFSNFQTLSISDGEAILLRRQSKETFTSIYITCVGEGVYRTTQIGQYSMKVMPPMFATYTYKLGTFHFEGSW